MKVVIVGSGNVGYHLANLLVAEGHDIIVIDSHTEKLNKMIETLDIIGVNGNGSYYDVQMEADVPSADLLIAVTPRDEVNMICCLLAKKLGAGHTIARVRSPEYSKQLHMLKDELGLSMSINPESAAAREIARILKFPSALKIDTLAKGLVELVQFQLNEDNPLVNKSLHSINLKYAHHILICAVERDNEVIMPTGKFVLKSGDKVHVIGKGQEITRFFKSINRFLPKSKYVMIVGGGHIPYNLANQISSMGMQVKIIEQDKSRCEELCELLPQVNIIQGDGSSQDVLLTENISRADAFIALTESDEINLITSMFAKSQNVPKVITKIDRSKYSDVLNELGIVAISPQFITSNTIARYVRSMQNKVGNSVQTLYKIVNENAEAIEFIAKSITKHLGEPLHKLNLKKNILIAALVREGRVIIPGGNDKILPEDNVIIVTTQQKLNDLNDIFTGGIAEDTIKRAFR